MILYYYHYIIIIIIIYILKLCNSELRDYVSINKIRLPITNSIVTSLEPKSWLNKALTSTRSKIQDNISIREVIYIPNPLSFECFDDYIDDDHFISCIVDKGYPVNILTTSEISQLSYQKAITELVKYKMQLNVPARTLAIVTHEIVTPWLLSYLHDIALPMTPSRQDIGAIAIIDTPPPLSYITNSGNTIVKRYIDSYNNYNDYKKTIMSSSLYYTNNNNKYNRLSWKSYRKRINEINGLNNILNTNNIDVNISINNNNNNDNNNNSDNVDYDDDFRRFTGIKKETDKEFEYDKAVFLASLGKKKKRITTRSLASTSISIKNTDNTNSNIDNIKFISKDVNDINTFLGNLPIGTKALSIGNSLKDRILIVNTIDNDNNNELIINNSNIINNDNDDNYFENLFPNDNWGYEAADELAHLYNAGPVIRLDNKNDDDDDDDDINDDDINDDDDDINTGHKRLSTILTDWLSMLSIMKYL